MFCTPFADAYQRVNKSHCRNIRCFPTCSKDGHKPHGFCGREVVFYPVLTEETLPAKGTRFFAEFCVKDSPLRSGMPGISEPGVWEAKWMLGDQFATFNSELRPYSYNWVSSRHLCNVQHVLRVYVHEPNQPVRCIDSSPFLICTFRGLSSGTPPTKSPSVSALSVVIQAMRFRFTAEKNDLMDWEALNDMVVDVEMHSPEEWLDEPEALPDTDMTMLLSVERLDGHLERISAFIFENFPRFVHVEIMAAKLASFLAEFEPGVTLESLANEATRLFGIHPPSTSHGVIGSSLTTLPKWINVEDYVVSAVKELSGMLPPGSSILTEFPKENSITGRYKAPFGARSMFDTLRKQMGWSEFEREVLKHYVDSEVELKVLSSRCVSVTKPGGAALLDGSVRFLIAQPYWIEASGPVFHSIFGGLSCVFAHQRGTAMVKGADDGKGVRMLAVFSMPDRDDAFVQSRISMQVVDESGKWITIAHEVCPPSERF